MTLAIRATPSGLQFAVKAVPGSSRDRVAGLVGDALKVTVTAAPEKGRANERIVEVLAAALALPRAAVTLVRGATNSRKVVQVQGLTIDELRVRLSL